MGTILTGEDGGIRQCIKRGRAEKDRADRERAVCLGRR